MPQNYFGSAHCCNSFGKPKNLEVQIVALGKFYDTGKRVRDFVAEQLNASGLYTFRTAYTAIAMNDENVHYANDDHAASTDVHEEFHQTFAKSRYFNPDQYDGLAFTYFELMNESLACAFEFKVLADNSSDESFGDIEAKINKISDWGRLCYKWCMNVTGVDRPEIFEDKVMQLMSQSFCVHEDYNWLALVLETQYFGLFEPCFNMIYDLPNYDEQWKHAYKLLLLDPTAREHVDFLNSFLEEKRGILGPLIEKTVQKCLFEYRGDADKFQLIFIAPEEKDVDSDLGQLKELENKVREQFGSELSSLGEPTSRIWANCLKLGL